MEKEFVPYELAVKLKALGFNEECFGYWDSDKVFELNPDFLKGSEMDDTWLTAPTFSQAFRWFKMKHGLFGIIYKICIIGNQWYYKITNRNNSPVLPFQEGLGTYEEAETACLTKLIEIIELKSE